MDAFATFDELQTHLGRTLDDQEAAEQALLLASGAIRAYCHWVLSYTEDAPMQVYGDGSRMISLPTLWLTDVTRISVNGVDQGPPDQFVNIVWSRKGQIHRADCWPKDCVVDVIVNHGYEPIPDVIKLVNLDAASRQITNPEGLVSATTGEVSRTWSSASSATVSLTPLHQALLDNHRLFT